MTDIPWGALRSLTAREIISGLIRDGFSLHNQRGSVVESVFDENDIEIAHRGRERKMYERARGLALELAAD